MDRAWNDRSVSGTIDTFYETKKLSFSFCDIALTVISSKCRVHRKTCTHTCRLRLSSRNRRTSSNWKSIYEATTRNPLILECFGHAPNNNQKKRYPLGRHVWFLHHPMYRLYGVRFSFPPLIIVDG